MSKATNPDYYFFIVNHLPSSLFVDLEACEDAAQLQFTHQKIIVIYRVCHRGQIYYSHTLYQDTLS